MSFALKAFSVFGKDYSIYFPLVQVERKKNIGFDRKNYLPSRLSAHSPETARTCPLSVKCQENYRNFGYGFFTGNAL